MLRTANILDKNKRLRSIYLYSFWLVIYNVFKFFFTIQRECQDDNVIIAFFFCSFGKMYYYFFP